MNSTSTYYVRLSQTMFMLLVLFLFLHHLPPTDQSPSISSLDTTIFSFPTFTSNSCINGELICTGASSSRDGYINLTPEQDSNGSDSGSGGLPINQVGRVLYPQPVLAWPAIITTSFTIRISTPPNSKASGDGMAFLFAQDDNPSPPGSYGSYLGILDRSTEGGVIQQLAVEFDSYMNEFDIDGNHIGIDTTSITNSIVAKSLSTTGIDLKSGRDIKVRIDYDGFQKRLQISVAYAGNSLANVLNHSIEMSKTVPAYVYVGFSGSTGPFPESHQVINWMFSSIPLSPASLKDGDGKDKIKSILVIVFPVIIAALLAVLCIVLFTQKAPRIRNGKDKKEIEIEKRSRSAANVPKMFTYKELEKATENFSKENLLGTGGFGSVYKGTFLDPPVTVAVKKISATSNQGEREYMAEICTIGRMRHKNIVQLQGWCHEGDHLLLVYQYMANGSLDRFIGKNFLEWKSRYNILTGLASALLYLHEECGNPVVHRDVKPNNVMLDSNYNACLGDFGLARLLQNDAAVTTMLAGTPGYLAPEVAYTGKATLESDVYSFGMVAIEVVCGRRSKGVMEENSLVDHVWSLYGKGELLECVDRKLEGNFDEEQVKRTLVVGLACLHPDSACRPRMRKVVQIFMNPCEPLMVLPEARPSSVCIISVHSSPTTTTDFYPRGDSTFFNTQRTFPNDIVDYYEHDTASFSTKKSKQML